MCLSASKCSLKNKEKHPPTNTHTWELERAPLTTARTRMRTLACALRTHTRACCALRLTVGLLVLGTGTTSTELLGLCTTGIGDEEGAIVGDQQVPELFLLGLIDVYLQA